VDVDVEQTPPHLVVGVDGSVEAIAALRWAVGHAAGTGGRVTALAVRPPTAPVGGAVGFGASAVLAAAAPSLDDEMLQSTAEGWLDAAVARLPPGAGRSLERRVVVGDPATVLLEAARDAAVLVLGNHGRGAVAGAVLGSVVHRCVPDAPCTLVLVPAPAPADGTGPAAAR
jgi:nucleotide-binding universal stress UspA family protein